MPLKTMSSFMTLGTNLVSEVIVNFDELVDPADQTIRFDHELLSEGEPELMPAKALPINDGGDSRIAGHSIAAFEALAEGRWKDAADGFRIVCNELPGDPAALNDFGLALRQIAMEVHESNPTPTPAEEPHFEAAVLALRQAAQQDDKPYDSVQFGYLFGHLWSPRRSHSIWDATITLSPQDPAPLNGKAVSLIAQGEFDAASALLMRAREIAPSESIILRNLRRLADSLNVFVSIMLFFGHFHSLLAEQSDDSIIFDSRTLHIWEVGRRMLKSAPR